ncbi:hypothetical protein [Leptolyngbya sp. 7M]|nr:hypothetical protein [Leptolyngbya sp. 7M]QYO62113.1 hypothetical protein JVX88_18515 [Leptolyngbya sp. 7M]
MLRAFVLSKCLVSAARERLEIGQMVVDADGTVALLIVLYDALAQNCG